jgi:hypothetical protein
MEVAENENIRRKTDAWKREMEKRKSVKGGD